MKVTRTSLGFIDGLLSDKYANFGHACAAAKSYRTSHHTHALVVHTFDEAQPYCVLTGTKISLRDALAAGNFRRAV